MKIHRPQWSTAKPLIQWQWLDFKKPLKNHWYQWFKFDKIIDDNGWIVKILEKTIGYNGFFSKTIDHSIVLKKWPSLWSSHHQSVLYVELLLYVEQTSLLFLIGIVYVWRKNKKERNSSGFTLSLFEFHCLGFTERKIYKFHISCSPSSPLVSCPTRWSLYWYLHLWNSYLERHGY